MIRTTNNLKSPLSKQELDKIRPEKTKMDRERLAEDTFHLKNDLSDVKNYNSFLKSRLARNEQENLVLENTISDIESFIMKKFNKQVKEKTNDSNLVVGLRKQISEVNGLIGKREETLQTLKKNPKYVKIQELDMEINSFIEEIQKLQQFLNDYQEKNSKKKDPLKESEIYEIEFLKNGPEFDNLKDNYAKNAALLKILEEQNSLLEVLLNLYNILSRFIVQISYSK